MANSVKHDPGRCIAGRQIAAEDNDVGTMPWVRPISRMGEGELSRRQYTLEDGSVPQIFDMIEIYVDAPDSDLTQPENWVISDDRTWKQIRTWDISMVTSSFVEVPSSLWLQPGVKTDRVTKEFLAANPPQQSLYFLELHNAKIIRTERNKYRLLFSHNGTSYNLVLIH